MGVLTDVGQKIRGKGNKAKGRIKQHSPDIGDKISGVYDEVKGSIQDAVADIKLDNDTDKRRDY